MLKYNKGANVYFTYKGKQIYDKFTFPHARTSEYGRSILASALAINNDKVDIFE